MFPQILQTQHVYCTLKRRGKDSFHVLLTWNTRGVFVGYTLTLEKVYALFFSLAQQMPMKNNTSKIKNKFKSFFYQMQNNYKALIKSYKKN